MTSRKWNLYFCILCTEFKFTEIYTMVATLPMNRFGFDSPPAELPALPQSARERGRLWSDTVFQAVLVLKKQGF